ncbi:MAG: hypothetical protein GX790_03045 [Syntrophomonadaceae bacterium]|nr:hypothetical protein [Syntrophomonadaceae bacterium]
MKKFIAGSVTLGLLVLAPVNIADACTSPVSKAPIYRIVLSDSVGQKQTSQLNTVKKPVIKVVKKTTINLQKNSPGTSTSNPKPVPTPSPAPETTPTPVPNPVPTPNPTPEVTLDEVSLMQMEMLNYINAERAKANLAPLVLDKELSAGAYAKSKDMAVNNYFSHTSPTYGSPFKMMKDRGISYRMAAENIAKNTTIKGAHNAFMNSSGHRANILNSGFNKIGLGIYQEGKYLYITQWFTN